MIKKLSENTIKKIAAGEVISKPYNAIKEIIENAIDAQATEIRLFFEEYGMKSIIIIDNGTGISEEDLILAPQLHTTSKTTENETIFGINSFGFRGEALASIDAVSHLIIESNKKKLENGKITHSLIEQGTKITIQNLFQNVPARLKFIKNEKHEFKLIKELLKQMIIQHNHIKWQTYHNNKIIFNTEITSKIDQIQSIFQEKPIQKTIEQNNTKIIAYILKQQINLSIIFINQRLVKDKAIFRYISSLFKEYNFIHENPGYILEITIDPLLVDYNVHPSKEEVKLMEYKEIFQILNKIFSMDILAQQLHNSDIKYEEHISSEINIHESNDITAETTETETETENKTTFSYFKPSNLLKHLTKNVEESDDLHLFQPNLDHHSTINTQKEINNIKLEKELTQTVINLRHDHKIIGQLQNSYILFENEKGLGIFDQHAAHERQIYEKLKQQLNNHSSQILLSPISLKLSPEQIVFLEENKEILREKGIEIANQSIIAIPAAFKYVFELTNKLQNIEINTDISTEIDRLLANIACKQALKANKALSIEQMASLLQEALNNPPICNHGRPVFKYFSSNEIKNFFKR